MGQRFRLEQVQIIPRSRPETFAFFANPRNLERLTPDFVRLRINTPGTVEMQAGAIIGYSLRLFGVPLTWRARIEKFEPNLCFADSQLSGPYRYWYHVHTFEDAPQGTRMTDTVDYELPFGPLGTLAHAMVVRRILKQLFAYRAEALTTLLAPPHPP